MTGLLHQDALNGILGFERISNRLDSVAAYNSAGTLWQANV